MSRFRVLIIGAYGQFGRRIASALACDGALERVLAGRHRDSADALAAELQRQHPQARLSTAALDVESPGLADGLARLPCSW